MTDPLEELAVSMADALDESGIPPKPKPKHAGGRGTTEDEVKRWLRKAGLPAEEMWSEVEGLPEAPADDEPVTLDGVRTKLLKRLNDQIPHLKGNALSQTVRTIEALARMPMAEDGEGDPLIAEVIAGTPGLPMERRREILEGEMARLETERVAIEEALKGCVVAA